MLDLTRSTRTRVSRRIAADPTSTALLLAGPTAVDLWPGARRVAEGDGLVVVDTLELKDAKTKALMGMFSGAGYNGKVLVIDGDAVDAGFKRALSTILDSNITTFIAAAVLFYIGTGPVRGFAVTLGIGIITTVFTAFTLTRLIVAGWAAQGRWGSAAVNALWLTGFGVHYAREGRKRGRLSR